jgi:hypothetical protein
LVALFEELPLWLLLCTPGDQNPPLMEPLEAVNQHGAIFLVEDVLAHLDNQIGSDPDEVLVEGSVVELAEGQAVRDHRGSERVHIRHDVRCIEKLLMLEPTERASLAIRAQHPQPKGTLVEPLPSGDRDVLPAGFLPTLGDCLHAVAQVVGIIHRHLKPKRSWFVADYIHRPGCEVFSLDHPVEIDERPPLLHGPSQPHVLVVLRVCAPVPVQEQRAVGRESVVVRRRAARIGWCRRDGKRKLRQRRGLKMPWIPFSGTRCP